MQGLDWQTLQLSLGAGLMQRADDRARQPPYLDIAKDVQFDELGGLQTRYPYAALTNSILGGGTISDARRIVVNGDELLCFTKDSIYSWSAGISKWVRKATHLAVKVDEDPVFVTTGDQTHCDRAELSGTIVYVYRDPGASGCYVGAIDKTTGAVQVSPTLVEDATRPRLVALSTKILFFYVDSGSSDLNVLTLDPADVATSLAATPTQVWAASNSMYDVTRVIGADEAVGAVRLSPTTSYGVFRVASNSTVTDSTKARTCVGPIAVSCTPDGTQVQIVRTPALADLSGDLLTISTLADVNTSTAIEGSITATVANIAAAHRSTQDSGAYRCYVFWNDPEELTITTAWSLYSNWIDTSNNVGTAAELVKRIGVASRAFDHDGRVYVTCQFASSNSFTGSGDASFPVRLQNTYFLYRDDGFLAAKAAPGRGGGFLTDEGWLPGVASTASNTYAWCGTERRIVPLGGEDQFGYADRGPRDVVYTFDSNEARRCARLGRTLYIAAGELLQYDGTTLTEVGFHVFPWSFELTSNNTGSMEDGDYAYKATWRSENAQGERDRSAAVTTCTVTISGGTPSGTTTDVWSPLYTTHKTGIAAEMWRTPKNPTADSPFYLATNNDPTDLAGANRYVPNDTAADTLAVLATPWTDELADADLTIREESGDNGGVLENLAPPAASIIIASDTRLFLAGVPGEPDRVVYSKVRQDGHVASFHDALTVDVPPAGGDITGLAILNDTLVVFRERAIYALPGQGFGNFGDLDGSQNFGPARVISSDVGAVNHESIALTDKGLVFKSSKGWYLLNRGWALDYIGAAVTDYDSETPLAVDVVASQHQIRILTASRMLVWDYLANQWGEWTISDGVHAALWGATHVYLTSTGPKQQLAAYTSLTYGMDVETTWIKPADLQGAVRLRWLSVLGEYLSAHDLRIRIAYDYSASYTDDRTWTVSPTTVGGPEQVRVGPSRQQCQAFKVRLTAQAVGSATPPTGAALKLTGLAAELGIRRGIHRRLPAAQKV